MKSERKQRGGAGLCRKLPLWLCLASGGPQERKDRERGENKERKREEEESVREKD